MIRKAAIATGVLLVLLTLYVLSPGPVYWLVSKNRLPGSLDFRMAVYQPIEWARLGTIPAYVRYVDSWRAD